MSDEKNIKEEISSRELPLSTVENTPPLMLDLPDGQQLVVGKLPDGIVIEIATWRGTGRPDSRTNRMMLGVSYDEDEEDEKPKRVNLKRLKNIAKPEEIVATPEIESAPPVSESVPAVEVIPEVIEPVLEVAQEVIEPLVEAVPEIIEPVVDAAPEVIEPVVEEIPVAIEPEDEVANIVASEVPEFVRAEPIGVQRNMQDLFGARPRNEIDEQSQNKKSIMDRGHEIVRKESKKSSSKKITLKSFSKAISTLAIIGITAYLLIVPAGLRFTLPEGGLRTSMSSAENALVIVRISEGYEIGDSVVAPIDAPGNPLYFASIAAQSDTEYVLTENNLYHSTKREEVVGKVLLVMPGIGYVLHKVGL